MIDSNTNIVTGTFVKELKNRFLCEVVISGIPTECYVPSSCHLSNFLELAWEAGFTASHAGSYLTNTICFVRGSL